MLLERDAISLWKNLELLSKIEFGRRTDPQIFDINLLFNNFYLKPYDRANREQQKQKQIPLNVNMILRKINFLSIYTP